MLHLKLIDGSDIYINSLAIRFVTASETVGQCNIFYDSEKFHTVMGEAKKIADTIHKALHIIHMQS